MKIAFLILAHHQPAMMLRLIRRLDSPAACFFVHVDAKSDVAPFKKQTEGYGNVFYVSERDRKNIVWGGFNTVAATIRLMSMALGHAERPDRLCLLSGVDYPIKPLGQITEGFSSSRQYLQIQRKLETGGMTPFERRANRYFLGNSRIFNPRSGPGFLTRPVRMVEHRVRREFPRGIEIYYGSNWWCLTYDAAAAVLAFFEDRPEFLRWCRWTAIPDELFVQTALKAGPFAGDIAYDYSGVIGLSDDFAFDSMHFLDWKNANPTTPKLLELDDLPRLRASPAMFARKFDLQRSGDLLDALDKI